MTNASDLTAGPAKRFTITRFCCSSGDCIGCHERGGSARGADRRVRVVQLTTDSEARAYTCVANFARLDARLEERAHLFNVDGQPAKTCWCGKYHYRCGTCGVDYTAAAAAGAAFGDTTAHRCRECHRAWDRLLGAFSPRTAEEVKAIQVALSQIADASWPLAPEPVTAELRKLATEILCRGRG